MDPTHKNDSEGSTLSAEEEQILQARIHGEIGFRYDHKLNWCICDMCDSLVKPRNKTKHLNSQRHIDRCHDYIECDCNYLCICRY
jgi:hypothetical protein